MRRALRTMVCAIELAILYAMVLEMSHASVSQRDPAAEAAIQPAAADSPSGPVANTMRGREDRRDPRLQLPDLSPSGHQGRPDTPHIHSRLTGSPQSPGNGSGLWWKDDQHRTWKLGVHIMSSGGAARTTAFEEAHGDPETGALEGGAPLDRNQVWSIALNSHLLGNWLYLHGAYAGSRQPHSTWDRPPAPEHGQAYRLLTGYTGAPIVLSASR